eukprot:m.24450 g.24450  ORF g.24450 m.24450 type:complete len:530 (+) comp28621_c0_seq2:6-1595(+)
MARLLLRAGRNACNRRFLSFSVVGSTAEISSPAYADNAIRNTAAAEHLNNATEASRAGGGSKAVERHTKLNKKLFVRERLRLLLDPSSPFLEFSTLAGIDLPYGSVPGGGVVAGIGAISGRLCVVMANDATVKGGSVFPITLRKQLRAQDIAMQNRLPLVVLVDSGGAFLPMQAEIFPDRDHGGRVFYNQAIMSSLKIPVISMVCGSCTAGAAYIPTMSQEAIIIKGLGSLFLGGPPLVKAATGEDISVEELGGADLHCGVSGCTDHYAETEEEGIQMLRNVVATVGSLASHWNVDNDWEGCDPLWDPAEIQGLIPSSNSSSFPMLDIIGRLVDGSRFQSFKQKFGKELITGYAQLYGQMVGILANDGPLTAPAAYKGAHFVQLCHSKNLPMVFLQNTFHEKDAVDAADAKASAHILKARAEMMRQVALAAVPKITVIVGDGIGSINFAMCGKSARPNFMYLWPNARVGLFDSWQNEKSESKTDGGTPSFSAFHSSSRVWDDGIISPETTRQVLHLSLTAALQKRKVEI